MVLLKVQFPANRSELKTRAEKKVVVGMVVMEDMEALEAPEVHIGIVMLLIMDMQEHKDSEADWDLMVLQVFHLHKLFLY